MPQIVSATINSSTDVPPSREHMIASTGLRGDPVLLPVSQSQVIVLETADDATRAAQANGLSTLVREASVNVTSVGALITNDNLYTQPTDGASPSYPCQMR